MMRKLHRWFGLVSGVFMIIIAITGAALQVEMTLNNHPALRVKTQAPPPMPPLSDSDKEKIGVIVAASINEVGLSHPDLSIGAIQVNRSPRGVSVSIGEGGRGGKMLKYDEHIGSLIPIEQPAPDKLHKFLIDLHGGFLFGPVGQVISFLMGAALVLFSVTGLVLYFDMFARRRKIGKKGWFW